MTYRGVIANPFMLDDSHAVEHNPAVQSIGHVTEWFLSPHATSGIRQHANYRPILVASYSIDRALWGPSAAGYHAVNLAIHLGTVVLVFVLGRRLTRDGSAAACAAGLFALHPVNAEAVNYITARSSSLTAVSVLAAIWASEHAADCRSRAWRVVAYALGATALGSKEVAVVLPLLVIVWRRAAHGETEGWADTLRCSAPWWLLSGLYLGLRIWILWGLMTPAAWGPGVTVEQNVLFALKIYAASIGHWVWPSGLAIDHAWPLWITTREGAVIVGALAAALVGTTAILRRHPMWGWCVLWFWTAILPVGALGFVTRQTLYQDNRVYLAGVGLSWLGGHLLAVLFRMAADRPIARFMCAASVVVASGLTVAHDVERTTVWSSRALLWDDVLEKYPTSFVAHNGKGLVAFEEGRIEEARDWFGRAVRLFPGSSEGYKNLGIAFARLGDWNRASAALQAALSIDPRYTEARVNLGKVYEEMGRNDLALNTYDRAIHEDPSASSALLSSASILERQGRVDEALQRLRRVSHDDPLYYDEVKSAIERLTAVRRRDVGSS
jgi:Flp pilus assembly protein TadD